MSGKINEKDMAGNPERVEVKHRTNSSTNPCEIFAVDANTVKHSEPCWYFKAV